MSNTSGVILTNSIFQNVVYRNAVVSKVHEDDIYDIKFSTGRVRTYVENTSSVKFNSGDYVAVLLSEYGSDEICKIIGKGRRIQSVGSIPIIRV